jgi:3-dehydroquinate dehydratase I
MICLSIGKMDFGEALELTSTVQMIEFRADLLNWKVRDYAQIIPLIPNSIFTFRPGKISDIDRLESYKRAIASGVKFIDVELEASPEFIGSILEMVKGSATELILSYHNFDATPSMDELRSIISTSFSLGADLVKLACMVNNHADAARLLSLYQETGRKVVVGMGEKGKIVRLASVFLGAEFTFASQNKESATAPGQMTVQEFQTIINILNSES